MNKVQVLSRGPNHSDSCFLDGVRTNNKEAGARLPCTRHNGWRRKGAFQPLPEILDGGGCLHEHRSPRVHGTVRREASHRKQHAGKTQTHGHKRTRVESTKQRARGNKSLNIAKNRIVGQPLVGGAPTPAENQNTE